MAGLPKYSGEGKIYGGIFRQIDGGYIQQIALAKFDRLPVADMNLKKIAKLPASVTFFRQVASIQIRQFYISQKNWKKSTNCMPLEEGTSMGNGENGTIHYAI